MATYPRTVFYNDEAHDLRPTEWEGDVALWDREPSPPGEGEDDKKERPSTPRPLTPEGQMAPRVSHNERTKKGTKPDKKEKKEKKEEKKKEKKKAKKAPAKKAPMTKAEGKKRKREPSPSPSPSPDEWDDDKENDEPDWL